MRVVAPEELTPVDPGELTLEEVPGAHAAFLGAWEGADAHLWIACATRPVPIWLDELAPRVLAGMTGLARRHLELSAVQVGELVADGVTWSQRFTARGRKPVVGTNRLGFADRGTLLACTTVCEGACESVMAGVELTPGFVAREPNAGERALGWMIRHPRQTVGVAIALLVAAVVVLLLRRPTEDSIQHGLGNEGFGGRSGRGQRRVAKKERRRSAQAGASTRPTTSTR